MDTPLTLTHIFSYKWAIWEHCFTTPHWSCLNCHFCVIQVCHIPYLGCLLLGKNQPVWRHKTNVSSTVYNRQEEVTYHDDYLLSVDAPRGTKIVHPSCLIVNAHFNLGQVAHEQFSLFFFVSAWMYLMVSKQSFTNCLENHWFLRHPRELQWPSQTTASWCTFPPATAFNLQSC